VIYKSIPLSESRIETKGDARTIEGYASVFGVRDTQGDVVRKGAYSKTLEENFERMKVLRDHIPSKLIGKPVEAREDEHGLFTASRLSKTSLADETIALASDGILEMSVGIVIKRRNLIRMNDRPTTEITEAKLFEYSFVTFGANPGTEVTGVKEMGLGMADVLVKVPAWMRGVKARLGSLSDEEAGIVREAMWEIDRLLAKAEEDLGDFAVKRLEFPVSLWSDAEGVLAYAKSNGYVADAAIQVNDMWVVGQTDGDFKTLRAVPRAFAEEGEPLVIAVGGRPAEKSEDLSSEDEVTEESPPETPETKGTQETAPPSDDQAPDTLLELQKMIRDATAQMASEQEK
jgi:HK97 family phage prohead protease